MNIKQLFEKTSNGFKEFVAKVDFNNVVGLVEELSKYIKKGTSDKTFILDNGERDTAIVDVDNVVYNQDSIDINFRNSDDTTKTTHINNATTEQAGLMSANDKQTLNDAILNGGEANLNAIYDIESIQGNETEGLNIDYVNGISSRSDGNDNEFWNTNGSKTNIRSNGLTTNGDIKVDGDKTITTINKDGGLLIYNKSSNKNLIDINGTIGDITACNRVIVDSTSYCCNVTDNAIYLYNKGSNINSIELQAGNSTTMFLRSDKYEGSIKQYYNSMIIASNQIVLKGDTTCNGTLKIYNSINLYDETSIAKINYNKSKGIIVNGNIVTSKVVNVVDNYDSPKVTSKLTNDKLVIEDTDSTTIYDASGITATNKHSIDDNSSYTNTTSINDNAVTFLTTIESSDSTSNVYNASMYLDAENNAMRFNSKVQVDGELLAKDNIVVDADKGIQFENGFGTIESYNNGIRFKKDNNHYIALCATDDNVFLELFNNGIPRQLDCTFDAFKTYKMCLTVLSINNDKIKIGYGDHLNSNIVNITDANITINNTTSETKNININAYAISTNGNVTLKTGGHGVLSIDNYAITITKSSSIYLGYEDSTYKLDVAKAIELGLLNKV